MELFEKLGAEIEGRWLEKNYNEDELPAIASDALQRADIPSKISAWDVIEWSITEPELPPQRDLPGRFGEPPITIFSGPRFHIDVYFWFEGTTSIHQHAFCGAFQVLMGSSIHSWHEFECREAINTFCEIGDMSLKVCELLEIGAVQEIRAGKQYIHSLFHLEQPSATIVVRTDRSPLHLPQYEYFKPGLAIDTFFKQPTTTKKLQALSALFRAKHADADRIAADLLGGSDLQTSFTILSDIRALLKSDRISHLFKLAVPKERFSEVLKLVRDRHGASAEVLTAVFEEFDVVEELVNRRAYVTQPEHRFFLALMLNLDNRERIFSLIRQRYADADPIKKILEWVFDLSQTRVFGIEAANALGVPDFGEPEMVALENLLHGKPDDEIAAIFASENPDSEPGIIISAIAKIRGSVVFRRLLVE